jgi:hypothetical protein
MTEDMPDEPLRDRVSWWLYDLKVSTKRTLSDFQSRVNRSLYRLGVCGAIYVVTHSATEFDVYCSECHHEFERSAYYFSPNECPECGVPFLTTIHHEVDR